MKPEIGKIKQYAQSIYGAEPQSMDELGHAVIKIINEYRVGQRWGHATKTKAKCVGLAWEVTHSEKISNSHSSPEGYPRNWGSKPNIPTGYEGWSGRVWVRYEKDIQTFGSDAFEYTLTHTGTGGAGSYDGPWKQVCTAHWNRYGHGKQPESAYPKIDCYSWDFKIFDSDWPEISDVANFRKHVEKFMRVETAKWKKAKKHWEENDLKKHNEAAMLAKLEDRWIGNIYPPPAPVPPKQIEHNFLWEDPQTKANDIAFIKSCAPKDLVSEDKPFIRTRVSY